MIAVAFGIASIVGIVHEANTPHVRCAEHGEMIHGDRAGTTADAAATAISEIPGSSTAEGHEHCSLASAMHQSRIAPHIPTLAPIAIAIERPAVAPAPLETPHARSLYRTAPKTSPPALV